jgi:hypothetical protein
MRVARPDAGEQYADVSSNIHLTTPELGIQHARPKDRTREVTQREQTSPMSVPFVFQLRSLIRPSFRSLQ